MRSVHLGQAFDELIVSLAEKLAMLPYVSRLTADAVRKSRTDPSWLTGSEQEVVVLFADLRGFTSFSENRNAGQVVTELNQLLAVAADSVISCGGDVDKFVGDCIMAVFIKRLHSGGKDQGLSPEAAALKCAEQMIRHVDQEARSHGWALAMGVGIHCGPVVVGSIGSSARRDFTAIGHTVNLASRLCGKAAGGQVLISDTFHATLAPEAQALFVRSEPLLLKNVSQTVTAYGWYVQQPAAVIQ
jgi:adenylate cyclase